MSVLPSPVFFAYILPISDVNPRVFEVYHKTPLRERGAGSELSRGLLTGIPAEPTGFGLLF
jgi:hypothetical protein